MATKWYRVAVSGPTVDGRTITPQQIDQMAASYNRQKYGARVWNEHLRTFMPEGPFQAYGDVLAVRADAGPEAGQRALFVQLEPTAELVRLNQARQKIFSSIEMDPNFQGSGQAYLVGLSVTDTPASTFTEILKFNLTSPTITSPAKEHLFSVYAEAGRFEEEKAADDGSGLFTKLKELLNGGKGDSTRMSQMEAAILEIGQSVGDLRQQVAKLAAGAKPEAPAADSKAAADDVAKLAADLKALTDRFATASPTAPRPTSAGGGTETLTDC